MMETQKKRDQELEHIVTCAICTSRLQEPKHLNCQHAFCTGCLRAWVATPANFTASSISCPTCRALTDIPVGGVPSLPIDFIKKTLIDMLSMTDVEDPETDSTPDITCAMCQMNGDISSGPPSFFCEHCDEYICESHIEDHNNEPALACHPVRQVGQSQGTSITCSMHKNKKLDFFCPKCELLVCTVCIRTKHRGHDAQGIDLAASQKKSSIKDHCNDIGRRLSELGEDCLLHDKEKMGTLFAKTGRLINRHANVAKQAIDAWSMAIMQDLEEKKIAIRGDVSTREEHVAKLKSLYSYCQDLIDERDTRTVLNTYDEVQSQTNKLLCHEYKEVRQLVFKPTPWPASLGYLEFDTGDRSRGALPVCSGKTRDPPTTQHHVEPESSMTSEDDLTTEASGHAPTALTIAPVSEHAAGGSAAVEDVAVEVLHVWKAHGNDLGRINCPDDVIIGPGSSVWLLVAERSRRRVQRLWYNDHMRQPEEVLAGFQPGRLAMATDGSVAVTDPYHGIVHMLVVNTRDQSISTRPKWTPTRMIQPWGVAFSQDCRHIALSDMHNHVVVVYDDKLHHVHTIEGQWFSTPGYLCFDPDNKLIVSDFTNNTVQAFMVDGKFLWEINCSLVRQDDLVAPRGVATDSSGNILVATRDGVRVFSSDGDWLCNLTNGPQKLLETRGIAVARKNESWYIAISDWTGLDYSSVQLWRL